MDRTEQIIRTVVIVALIAGASYVAKVAPDLGAAIAVPLVAAAVALAGVLKPPSGGAGGAAAVLAFVGASVLSSACHPTPGQIDAGVGAVSAGCALIEAITPDGSVRTVCATLVEIGELVRDIQAARGDAAPSARTLLECHYVGANGHDVCATGTELSAAIDHLLARRAASFVRVP